MSRISCADCGAELRSIDSAHECAEQRQANRRAQTRHRKIVFGKKPRREKPPEQKDAEVLERKFDAGCRAALRAAGFDPADGYTTQSAGAAAPGFVLVVPHGKSAASSSPALEEKT